MSRRATNKVACPFCMRLVSVRATSRATEALMYEHREYLASSMPHDKACEGSGISVELANQIIKSRRTI